MSIWQRPSRRLAKAAVNFSGICWTMTMPGLSGGSDISTSRSELGSARGRADADHLFGRARQRARRQRRRHHDVGGQLLLRLDAEVRAFAQRSARRRPHRIGDANARFGQELPRVEARLLNDLDRAGLERLEQKVRTRLEQSRAQHARDRPLRHQLAQESDAVHTRHLDVEDDDVGNLFLDALRGDERIRRRRHDFEIGRVGDDGRQTLPHRRRIVDDQHADSFRLGVHVRPL